MPSFDVASRRNHKLEKHKNNSPLMRLSFASDEASSLTFKDALSCANVRGGTHIQGLLSGL